VSRAGASSTRPDALELALIALAVLAHLAYFACVLD
jgi:hypothetical protein